MRRIPLIVALLAAMLFVASCSRKKVFTCETCGEPVTSVRVDIFAGEAAGTCPKGHETIVRQRKVSSTSEGRFILE